MDITVLFFGVLAEVTYTSVKEYSNVNSIADLKLRITDDFPELVHYNFRVSVNNEIVNQDPLLKEGDQVAYLPPFTGG
jgi:molybdopterin converting factor small subunit